jgi:hypothetical protein
MSCKECGATIRIKGESGGWHTQLEFLNFLEFLRNFSEI